MWVEKGASQIEICQYRHILYHKTDSKSSVLVGDGRGAVWNFIALGYIIIQMAFIWDYDRKELEKTEQGRILILERTINYGPEKGEKIKLADVKKYWDKLNLFLERKQLMELLIWGKIRSSQKDRNKYWA